MTGFSAFLFDLGRTLARVQGGSAPPAVVAAPPVFAPLMWCAECGDEAGEYVCYSTSGRGVFCTPTCRSAWEQSFEEES